jgi:chromosome segregation ATPase
MMGEYRNGKWTPTFGDEQFGVVDSPGQMYNRVRELEADNERLQKDRLCRCADEVRCELKAEIESLKADRDTWEATCQTIDKKLQRAKAEIAKLQAALEGEDE